MTTSRPVQGGSPGTWGTQLDAYLDQFVDSSGVLRGVMTGVFNVKDSTYGAAGNGTTDDTTAIQAAITACQSAGGGLVYLPAGTYKVSSVLTIIAAGVKFVGAGSIATVLKPTAAHAGPVLKTNGASALDSVEIKGFTIDMSNVNLIIGFLATGSGTSRSYITDVVVTGNTGGWPSVGFDFQNFGGKIADCTVANPTTCGYRINGDSSMVGVLEDCAVNMTDAAVTCADGFLIQRTTSPDNGGTYMRRCRTTRSAGTINYGFRIVSSNSGGTNCFVTMTDCIADNVNGGPSIRIDAMHNMRIVNGYFTRSVNSAIACELSACNDVTISNSWLPNVDFQLTPARINLIGNQMTQGGAAQVLKVDSANAVGDLAFYGNRVPPTGTVPLTNDFATLAKAQSDPLTVLGHEVLSARGSGSTRTFAIRDASATTAGKAKYFQVDANGNLLILNDAFTTVEHTLYDAGAYGPHGLTGAVAASRYVGGTTSGAPSTGTFAVGDYVVDQTGIVWICTVAGTPGSWVPSAPDWENYATGFLAPHGGLASNTSAAVVASRAYIVRFRAPTNLAVTKIAFTNTVAAGSNDNCDVGIFNSTLSTLLGSAGSTAGKLNATAGVQTLTLTGTVNLIAGTIYYAAFAASTIGTTAASLAMTTCQGASCNLMGAAAPNTSQNFQAAAFPLAAPFTVGGSIGSVPVLALLA